MLTALPAFLFIMYTPGYLAGALCRPLSREDPWVRLGVRLLLGLAFWPLLLAVTTALGVPLRPATVWAALVVMTVSGLLVAWKTRSRLSLTPLRQPENLLMAAILLATLALRWWQARDVPWPMWGDALNHSAATALIAQRGLIPSDWQPYIPDSLSFSYHFGFHTWAAALTWVTGMEPWWAVFWTERLLNALAPLTLYLLAMVFFRNRRAALGAALFVGLLTKMPQYYLNWSRDPQLGGQTLLPLLAYLAVSSMAGGRGRRRLLLLLALSVSSLIFVHYRVFVFALCLFATLALLVALRQRSLPRGLLPPALAVAGGVLLTAPWLVYVLRTQAIVARLGNIEYGEGFIDAYFGSPPLFDYLNPFILALAVVGALLAIRSRWREVLALAFWVIALVAAANGYRLGTRGLDLITYIAVFMVLYMPVSLAGGLLFQYIGRNQARSALPALASAGAIVAGFALHGDLVDRQYLLVKEPDVRAFAWVRENTSPSSAFLVNSFFASGDDGVVVGSDAGWWLPVATDRAASVPVINYGTEVVSPDYAESVRYWARLETADLLRPNGADDLCRSGFTHIYLGAAGGRLDGDALAADERYQLAYQDGEVRVFAIDCGPSSDGGMNARGGPDR